MTPNTQFVVRLPISLNSVFWSLCQPLYEGKTELKGRFSGRYL